MFPLCEVENGEHYTLTLQNRNQPVKAYLAQQKRYRHMTADQVESMQADVDDSGTGYSISPHSTVNRGRGCAWQFIEIQGAMSSSAINAIDHTVWIKTIFYECSNLLKVRTRVMSDIILRSLHPDDLNAVVTIDADITGRARHTFSTNACKSPWSHPIRWLPVPRRLTAN